MLPMPDGDAARSKQRPGPDRIGRIGFRYRQRCFYSPRFYLAFSSFLEGAGWQQLAVSQFTYYGYQLRRPDGVCACTGKK